MYYIKAVSYTHLDVYKRQIKQPKHKDKNKGNPSVFILNPYNDQFI